MTDTTSVAMNQRKIQVRIRLTLLLLRTIQYCEYIQ